MSIEICKLSPALLADFLNFFDNVAFEDHKEWAGCYCTEFHWDAELETEHRCSGIHKCGRDYAIEFIQKGILQGYLAYMEGEVVGWCNANDKTGYRRLVERPELWDGTEGSDKVKAVVCYIIAPNMRGKGIATQLLKRVYEDAAAEGYTYVEAYPLKCERDIFLNYYGPYAMYEKCGFSLYKTFEAGVIVRKYC